MKVHRRVAVLAQLEEAAGAHCDLAELVFRWFITRKAPPFPPVDSVVDVVADPAEVAIYRGQRGTWEVAAGVGLEVGLVAVES